MLLGDVLQALSDEAFAVETLLRLDDLALMAELERMRALYDESAPAYALGAVRRFASFASDDDWLALMGVIERDDDPGAACLRQMLAWSLRADRTHAEQAQHGSSCGCVSPDASGVQS